MKHKTREPSQRQLRVGEQLKHIIAEVLQRGHFHSETLLNSGRVTISEVRASPDLRNATAYVISMGNEKMDEIIAALNDESQSFQKEINRQSSMKFTPRIHFKEDEAFEEAQKIESLLRDINSNRKSDSE